jgi:hypothetical protein
LNLKVVATEGEEPYVVKREWHPPSFAPPLFPSIRQPLDPPPSNRCGVAIWLGSWTRNPYLF